MKRVAVLQSNYIPWKGYFDIIRDADTFIFYDDVQYTTNDWRNRNRIKTASGPQWLTIPVGKHIHRRVCDVALPAERDWAAQHWRKIVSAYTNAPFFKTYAPYFQMFYRDAARASLSEFNQAIVMAVSRDLLGLSTTFEFSTDYALQGTKGDRLLDLLTQVKATHYISGPAARAYLSEEELATAGMGVTWKDYSGYPAYSQLHGDFQHDVTILDLLFHVGPAAAWHIWGWREAEQVVAA